MDTTFVFYYILYRSSRTLVRLSSRHWFDYRLLEITAQVLITSRVACQNEDEKICVKNYWLPLPPAALDNPCTRSLWPTMQSGGEVSKVISEILKFIVIARFELLSYIRTLYRYGKFDWGSQTEDMCTLGGQQQLNMNTRLWNGRCFTRTFVLWECY